MDTHSKKDSKLATSLCLRLKPYSLNPSPRSRSRFDSSVSAIGLRRQVSEIFISRL